MKELDVAAFARAVAEQVAADRMSYREAIEGDMVLALMDEIHRLRERVAELERLLDPTGRYPA